MKRCHCCVGVVFQSYETAFADGLVDLYPHYLLAYIRGQASDTTRVTLLRKLDEAFPHLTTHPETGWFTEEETSMLVSE